MTCAAHVSAHVPAHVIRTCHPHMSSAHVIRAYHPRVSSARVTTKTSTKKLRQKNLDKKTSTKSFRKLSVRFIEDVRTQISAFKV